MKRPGVGANVPFQTKIQSKRYPMGVDHDHVMHFECLRSFFLLTHRHQGLIGGKSWDVDVGRQERDGYIDG